ncbi:MAG TPA: PaaI family thioesterase [Solirubrobacteraceae bacterium]
MSVPAGFEPLTASPFSERIGPLYLARPDSVPVLGLLVDAHHVNRAGRVHGGLLATVADIAVSRAAWDHVPEGATIATADLHISYLGNVNPGAWVEAWPAVDRVGRAVIHASCLVESDGEPLAKVLATVAVRLPSIPR